MHNIAHEWIYVATPQLNLLIAIVQCMHTWYIKTKNFNTMNKHSFVLQAMFKTSPKYIQVEVHELENNHQYQEKLHIDYFLRENSAFECIK